MKMIRSPPGNNTFEVSSSAMIQPTDQTSTKTKERTVLIKHFSLLLDELKKVYAFGGVWNRCMGESFMGEFFVQRELTYDLRIKNTLQIPPNQNDIFRHKFSSLPRKHLLERHA